MIVVHSNLLVPTSCALPHLCCGAEELCLHTEQYTRVQDRIKADLLKRDAVDRIDIAGMIFFRS
jgi:hypothetical protein